MKEIKIEAILPSLSIWEKWIWTFKLPIIIACARSTTGAARMRENKTKTKW